LDQQRAGTHVLHELRVGRLALVVPIGLGIHAGDLAEIVDHLTGLALEFGPVLEPTEAEAENKALAPGAQGGRTLRQWRIIVRKQGRKAHGLVTERAPGLLEDGRHELKAFTGRRAFRLGVGKNLRDPAGLLRLAGRGKHAAKHAVGLTSAFIRIDRGESGGQGLVLIGITHDGNRATAGYDGVSYQPHPSGSLTGRHGDSRVDVGSRRGGQVTDSVNEQIAVLEKRVEDLLRLCEQLREENRVLRESQESLNAERAALVEKNEKAQSRIEAMIARLKAMEQG